jgi:hypothetical protein
MLSNEVTKILGTEPFFKPLAGNWGLWKSELLKWAQQTLRFLLKYELPLLEKYSFNCSSPHRLTHCSHLRERKMNSGPFRNDSIVPQQRLVQTFDSNDFEILLPNREKRISLTSKAMAYNGKNLL